MDPLKFSLKTNKFCKRKHQIFQKKQSIPSLLIHQPSPDAPHFNDTTISHKSENQEGYFPQSNALDLKGRIVGNSSSLSDQNQVSSWAPPEAVRQMLQLSPEPKKSSSNYSRQKPNNLGKELQHRINQVIPQEAKLPQAISQLIWVRNLLLENGDRINGLVDSFNNLTKTTGQLYETHARHLRQVVAKRCQQFLSMLQKVLVLIENRSESVSKLDQRVSIFYNTLKESRETLRLLAIKQECLELQLANNSFQKIKETQKSIDPSTFRPVRSSEPIPQKQPKKRQQLITFDYWEEEETSQIDSKDFSPINQWKGRGDCRDDPSFLEKSQFLKQSELQIKSPLQSFPQTKIAPDQDRNFSQNIEQHEQYTFLSSSRPSQQNYQQLVKQVGTINKKQDSLWLDQMNCLRTGHGGYLLDTFGNAVLCSPKNYRKMLETGMIKNLNN